MGLNILGDIAKGIISPIAGLIDELSTSDEEKLNAKAKLNSITSKFVNNALGYEAQIIQEQASVIRTEAQSESWLARSWRPITMLVFVALVVMYWMGWSFDGMSEAEVLSVFNLIKIGLGGYVVGRSAEKIVPATVAALKEREAT